MFSGFSIEGVGVHSGHRVGVRIDPAPRGARIVFHHRRKSFLCEPGALAHNSPLCTTVGSVATVEHLLFALCACGVEDAKIRVRGGEIPILDGSAAPWISLLRRAGARGALRQFELTEPLTVEERSGRARLYPAPPGEPGSIHVTVDYPGFSGEKQIPLTGPALKAIAGARTFAFLRDVPAMRALGRIRGGGPHCALVLGDDGPMTTPRSADEPLDHKLLDAIGDLYILGALPRAHIRLERPGHALLQSVVRRLAQKRACAGTTSRARALP